jgi:hypothetical protein
VRAPFSIFVSRARVRRLDALARRAAIESRDAHFLARRRLLRARLPARGVLAARTARLAGVDARRVARDASRCASIATGLHYVETWVVPLARLTEGGGAGERARLVSGERLCRLDRAVFHEEGHGGRIGPRRDRWSERGHERGCPVDFLLHTGAWRCQEGTRGRCFGNKSSLARSWWVVRGTLGGARKRDRRDDGEWNVKTPMHRAEDTCSSKGSLRAIALKGCSSSDPVASMAPGRVCASARPALRCRGSIFEGL